MINEIINKYPSYEKIKKYLTTYQKKLYKNLVKENLMLNLILNVFNKTNINILKNTDRTIVISYKKYIVKLIFNNCLVYRSELYFSYLLYNEKIYSLSDKNICMLILPKYSINLKETRELVDIIKLKKDLIKELFNLHCHYIIHNDIKPSNIVKNSNGDWIFIDYGLTLQKDPNDSDLCLTSFKKGTPLYNIPNYNIECMKYKDLYFWLYMKDWYGLVKTLEYCNDNSLTYLKKDIIDLNRDNIRIYINEIAILNNIVEFPFYLNYSSV